MNRKAKKYLCITALLLISLNSVRATNEVNNTGIVPIELSLQWWTTNIVNVNRYKHSEIIAIFSSVNFSVYYAGTNFPGDPRDSADVKKAMAEYRLQHPICEYDKGSTPIEVHHILPVTPFPEFAACKWNYCSLCDKCHLSVGHAGSYQRYVPNLRAICNMVIVVEKDEK